MKPLLQRVDGSGLGRISKLSVKSSAGILPARCRRYVQVVAITDNRQRRPPRTLGMNIRLESSLRSE